MRCYACNNILTPNEEHRNILNPHKDKREFCSRCVESYSELSINFNLLYKYLNDSESPIMEEVYNED